MEYCIQRRMARTTITMPRSLTDKAHSLGINVSKTACIAIEKAVQSLEQSQNQADVVRK